MPPALLKVMTNLIYEQLMLSSAIIDWYSRAILYIYYNIMDLTLVSSRYPRSKIFNINHKMSYLQTIID